MDIELVKNIRKRKIITAIDDFVRGSSLLNFKLALVKIGNIEVAYEMERRCYVLKDTLYGEVYFISERAVRDRLKDRDFRGILDIDKAELDKIEAIFRKHYKTMPSEHSEYITAAEKATWDSGFFENISGVTLNSIIVINYERYKVVEIAGSDSRRDSVLLHRLRDQIPVVKAKYFSEFMRYKPGMPITVFDLVAGDLLKGINRENKETNYLIRFVHRQTSAVEAVAIDDDNEEIIITLTGLVKVFTEYPTPGGFGVDKGTKVWSEGGAPVE